MLYSDPNAYPYQRYKENIKTKQNQEPDVKSPSKVLYPQSYSTVGKHIDTSFNGKPEVFDGLKLSNNHEEGQQGKSYEQANKFDFNAISPLLQGLVKSNSSLSPLMSIFNSGKFDMKSIGELVSKNPQILTTILNLFTGKKSKGGGLFKNVEKKDNNKSEITGDFSDYEIIE